MQWKKPNSMLPFYIRSFQEGSKLFKFENNFYFLHIEYIACIAGCIVLYMCGQFLRLFLGELFITMSGTNQSRSRNPVSIIQYD